MTTLNIVHLYRKEMNIYGDTGNALVLQRRLEWRGVPVDVHSVNAGDPFPKDTHIILGGGGQDAGQSAIAADLKTKTPELKAMAADGVPMLMICGMYQMLGHSFRTQQDVVIPGAGVLDVYTVAQPGRLIGNVVATSDWGELVGYENHSGRTHLEGNARPLAHVVKGQGNNGEDGNEGARQWNVFGSYLHGPVLAKSPQFADHLLELALQVAHIERDLAPLHDVDALVTRAASLAKQRPR